MSHYFKMIFVHIITCVSVIRCVGGAVCLNPTYYARVYRAKMSLIHENTSINVLLYIICNGP